MSLIKIASDNYYRMATDQAHVDHAVGNEYETVPGNYGTHALVGGGVGAAGGALLGGLAQHGGWPGAAVGALGGAAIGGLLGLAVAEGTRHETAVQQARAKDPRMAAVHDRLEKIREIKYQEAEEAARLNAMMHSVYNRPLRGAYGPY